jgi:hypothetical protein
MKMKYFWIGILGFFLMNSIQLEAQNTFGAAIVAGLNASQIQGDASAGYNRLGVRAGLRGLVFLGDKSEASLDLLYSQRGSTSGLFQDNAAIRFVIALDYVEVPVTFTYKDWLHEDGYYRVHFTGGLTYSRLFNTRVEEYPIFEEEQENFNLNDFGVRLGASYFVSEKFGISIFYNRSINRLYNNLDHLQNGVPVFEFPLVGYFLSFEFSYRL